MKQLKFILVFLAFGLLAHAQDWPNFHRYRSDNEKLKSQPVPKERVVFMGNSITDAWINASPDFFLANDYLDRGIGGQTSPQMLVRFKADVIDLHPKAVVIKCGTNDIAGNTGPSTLEMIEDNIQMMAELAKAHKIKVIIGSVLPSNKFPWKPDLQPADSIIALNQWLSAYARSNPFYFVDYYSSLVSEEKGMKKEYSEDGVHPNKAGYTVMENLVQPVIRKAVK